MNKYYSVVQIQGFFSCLPQWKTAKYSLYVLSGVHFVFSGQNLSHEARAQSLLKCNKDYTFDIEDF